MLKIEFDPSTLSKLQREDLASFILGWDSGTLNMTTEVQLPKSAPLSADAAQSEIAPVDTQVNTSAGIAPPPPVPQPVFPANTAAPRSPNLAEVDSKGMLWDARIHSSSKAKVADGTWKYRRGVTPEEVAQVEAALQGSSHDDTMDAAALFAAGFNPPEPGSIAPPTEEQKANLKAAMLAPPPPAVPGEPDLRKQFAQLMIRVAQAKHDDKITAEEVTAALAEHAVQSLPMLSMKLDLVPSVAAAIEALISSRR